MARIQSKFSFTKSPPFRHQYSMAAGGSTREEEHMSDNERKQVEILAELAEKMTAEARTLWLAYGMGLADGAKTVEVQQAAG